MDAISPAAARPRSQHAPVAPSSARRAVLASALLTLALLVLLAAAGAERASACVSAGFAPLPLSSFEGADGDQCDSDATGPRRDWQTVAGEANLHTTVDAPSANDTTYGSNNAGIVGGSTSETVPDSWNFTYGNIGGGKFDALSAASFTDPENGKLFLDLGFVRATTTGDTFLAFELNQRQPGYRLDPNEADATKPFSVPTRTSGDLLVTFHVGTAGAEELGLCVWDGNEHSGQWEEFKPDLSGAVITNQSCPALSTALYQAAINDGQSGRQGAIPGGENYLAPGTAVGAGQFGEAVVNLTNALRDPDNPDGPPACIDFGYVWLHSRSSDSLTSNQQDFILPANSISIGSCTVEGMKFNDVDGNGARGAGEPYLDGWTIFVDYDNDGTLDNDLDKTFVNDMDGIVEAGEEEPYDVTADGTGTEALGSYRITTIQPSSHASNAAGTWPVREILPSTWDCTAAVGGGAVVAPNVCPEDTSTNPDSALGFRLAWNDNQTYSGRDFGNRRQPAQLKVVKHVVNDNGGSATAGAWSLHVKSGDAEVAGSPQPGDENGDTYSLTDGQSYSVSETGGPSGYAATFSGDCDANGAVTVTAGTLKTCTITNNDVAPVLRVVKHVVNDDGGTQSAADFSLTVDDVGTNPASFAGAEAPGTNVVIDPGAYAVSEGAHDGYAVTYSPECSGTLAVGQTATCTVTNDDIAPVLRVVKHVVNDDGGTQSAADFSLTVDDVGTNPAAFNGAEAPGTDVVVDPGAYTVSEGAHDGYSVSYSADCTGSLAMGQTKTCTVTNDDIAPVLRVVKHVVNDSGGTRTAADFSLTVDDPGDNPAYFNGAEAPGTDVVVDPGAYSVSEGPHAGYAVSYSADCSSTLAIGETRTCTVTNDDIAPGLTVIKHVVNDDGGTKTAGDFSLTVDDPGENPGSFPGSETGTEVVVDPGAYAVTEGTHDGYAVTYSAGCTGTLAIGETKTCTVTNDDIAPVLRVVKHVVNDDGGTQSAADFSLTVDDVGTNPAAFAGAEAPGTNVEIDPGAYSVTEGSHTGYAVTYSADCTGSLAIGQTATCTVTNNDIAPVLTVVKHVVNDDGGTKSAADFALTVDDPGTNPAPFAGAEAPGTEVTVDPGAYAVSEGAHAGYAVSYSAGCTGTLAIGEAKTCTVTNDDIAPVLTVVKHVVNDDGGTKSAADFSLTVDDPGTNPAPFAGAEAPGTEVTVDPGAYAVSEGAHAGYAVSYSAGCTGTLAIGETRTCTVTNDDIAPGLTVIKHVVNDDGGTKTAGDFSLTVDDPGENPGSFPGSETGTEVVVDPGAYAVTEGTHDGYAVTYSAGCTGTLAIGETKTCTVTNDDIAPVLRVVKHVVNDDGGTQSAADFALTVDDPGTNPAPFAGAEAPGTDVAINAGAYAVSEGAHDGYAVSYSDGCSGTLAIGETRTCTVTNNDIAPGLTVIKHVVNDDGGTKTAADFSLTVDDPGENPAAFAGAEAPGTNVTVDPGAYAVSEGAHDGYAVTYSDGCTGTLAIGETKTCTVTNNDVAPVLKVVKHMINGHGGTKSAADFSITVDDPGENPAPFAGAEAPGTAVTVDPGEYSVAEGAHEGYVVSYSDDCTGTLAIGETKTCTVTNNDIAPELTVIKEVVNKAGSTGQASDFTMHVTGNPITPDGFAGAGAPGVTKTLAAGPYEVSETGATTDDYSQSKSADCAGTLAIGDAKTCTITNTRKTGTITVRKNLVPADDGGRFDLAVDGEIVRDDASDGDAATIEVATGTHTVGELAGSTGALGDYVSSIACGDGDPVAGGGPLEVRVGDGDELTCTVTNTRRATITVRTVTQPEDPGKTASFGFTSGLPETPGPIGILLGGLFELADGDSVTTTVAPGERSVTEDDPAPLGYRLVGLTCTEDKEQNSTVSTGAALSTDRLAALVADPGETIVCTFTNRKVVGQAVVVKAGDTFAYHGESAAYTFAVSNTGNSSLHDVAVSDDKCANVSAAPTSRHNDNGDALLDPIGADATNPEVWIYTCSYTLGAHQDGEAGPVVNTATVTGLDELGRPVGDIDQHSTTLLHPAIALTKAGPATAIAGSRVVYAIAAKNTGDVAFAAALVVVTDARCEAPPLLIGTGGDASAGTLDPGDTWQYACAVQSAAGERAIHNVALVDGTDVNGRRAQAQATADTILVAPPAPRQAVAANVASGDRVLAPARAKLRGPTGCMPRTAKVHVTGKRIARVTFTLDGRAKRIVRRAGRGGRYTYSVRKAKVRTGTHRVRARVVYLAGSSATAKTLVMTLNKCRRAVVKPAFTG